MFVHLIIAWYPFETNSEQVSDLLQPQQRILLCSATLHQYRVTGSTNITTSGSIETCITDEKACTTIEKRMDHSFHLRGLHFIDRIARRADP